MYCQSASLLYKLWPKSIGILIGSTIEIDQPTGSTIPVTNALKSIMLPSLSSVTAGAAKVVANAKQVVTTAVQLPPVPTGEVSATVVTVRAVEVPSTRTETTATASAPTTAAEEGYLSKLGTMAKSGAASVLSVKKESCSHCGKVDSSLSLVTSFASQLERCRVCGAKLCRWVGV